MSKIATFFGLSEANDKILRLSPTISAILAIPQIALFGWLIPLADFPIKLASVGIIAFFGAAMTRKGLSYPKPIAKSETDEHLLSP